MKITFTVLPSGKRYYSDWDFGLVISRVIVGEPPIKTNLVEVPGANGMLDYTEYFGEPLYGNRPITIECGFVIDNRFSQESAIRNAIHGKLCKIQLSDDEDYYYIGRVDVGDIEKQVRVTHFTILCDCEPYKLKNKVTEVSAALDTQYKTIALYNEKRQVVPTVTVDAAATIKVGESTIEISIGTHRLLALTLGAGKLEFQAKANSGIGTITIRYQEASL